MALVLAAIADDFTGATDLANTWVKEGVRVTQIIGVPGPETDPGEAEAIVVALKSRTAPVADAVTQSLAALEWLRARGARQIVFKYCSTFDSTPKGNIGPVTDALLTVLDGPCAPVCPAFPANGRTVYQGHLFVWDKLLSESTMKDHPLTPMRDASLLRLIEAQGAGKAGLVPHEIVRQGPEAIRAALDSLTAQGCRYPVIDALTDDDLRRIGRAAADLPLITGGSGIGMGLPENLRRAGALGTGAPASLPASRGRALVLAGSCSAATRGQIAAVSGVWPTRKLSADALAQGPEETRAAIEWARAQDAAAPVLIYASADPDEVVRTQAKFGTHAAGAMFEDAFAAISRALVKDGFARIVVAGGETSGAVTSALGVTSLRIGPEIAPGVPWTETNGARPLALALKSGNFGSESFFAEAFAMLP